MNILENRDEWYEQYKSGWLRHYEETGEIKWDLYKLPNNQRAPATGKAIDLTQSRLLLISSAGAYLPATQEPYDAENALGDYTIRHIAMNSTPAEIAFAHTHYDHSAVNEDQQVLLPIGHLHDLVAEGLIGELAPDLISFMGYQPDAVRVAEETTPAIVAAAKEMGVQAALLVPS